jgi:hypothetical protein
MYINMYIYKYIYIYIYTHIYIYIGVGLIEDYRVYRKDDHDEISCVVKFGDKLNGHPGENLFHHFG